MKVFSTGFGYGSWVAGTWIAVLFMLGLSACSGSQIHKPNGAPVQKDADEWQIFVKRQGVLMSLQVARGGVKNAQTIQTGTLDFFSPVITSNGRYAAYITGRDDNFKLWFQEVSSRRNDKPLMVEQYANRPQSLQLDGDSRTLFLDQGLATEQQFNIRELGIRLRKFN